MGLPEESNTAGVVSAPMTERIHAWLTLVPRAASAASSAADSQWSAYCWVTMGTVM